MFDQEKNAWFRWDQDVWTPDAEPVINTRRFTATGTRFIEDNGKAAIEALFARSFKK